MITIISLDNILADAPSNTNIQHALSKCYEHITLNPDAKIMCSISGGSDSDIVLDMVEKFNEHKNIDYVFFNTGIEYEATLRHLQYLEDRYEIEIKRQKPVKSIPTCCYEFGLPLISKFVSGKLEIAQKHNFQFEDEPYEVLIGRYEHVKDLCSWWSNNRKPPEGFKKCFWNIDDRNPYLKPFIMKHPPNSKFQVNVVSMLKKMWQSAA